MYCRSGKDLTAVFLFKSFTLTPFKMELPTRRVDWSIGFFGVYDFVKSIVSLSSAFCKSLSHVLCVLRALCWVECEVISFCLLSDLGFSGCFLFWV